VGTVIPDSIRDPGERGGREQQGPGGAFFIPGEVGGAESRKPTAESRRGRRLGVAFSTQ